MESEDQIPEIPTVERKLVETKLEKIDRSFVDPYRWLREKENPDVIEYIKKENALYEHIRKSTLKTLEDEFYNEMVKLRNEDDVSIPFFLQGYFYYKKHTKGLEYPVYYRHKQCPPKEFWKNPEKSFPGEEKLLDLNSISKGKKHCQIGTWEISTNNMLYSYSLDFSGDGLYNIYVQNLASGEIVDEILDKPLGSSIAWANDNEHIFYLMKNKQKREYKLMVRKLGTKPEDDTLLLEEEDEAFYLHISKSLTEKYVLVNINSDTTTEYHTINLTKENEPFTKPEIFVKRERGIEYTIRHHHSFGFFVLHNRDPYINFRLQYISEEVSRPDNWTDFSKLLNEFEVLPYSPDRYITSMLVLKDFCVLWCRSNGFVEVLVLEYSGSTHQVHAIEFDEQNFDSWSSSNYCYDASFVRLCYSSLVTPISTYDYEVEHKTRNLLKREIKEEVFDPSKYVSESFYVVSRDEKKTKIPVSLVYNKHTYKRPGPCCLYAYGAYGSSSDPYFRRNIICMLDRGLVYVICHARGGCEKGRAWYKKEGKLLTKKNTFNDVNDTAKYLIDNGWTTPSMLCLYGVSAGGLLAACINEEPKLYGGAVFDVPFVDLMNTMIDETIPLTVREWEEWGNPNKLEYFDYMMSYSPYDNLAKMKDYYPNIFMLGNMNDSAVAFWEPLKFVANCRHFVKENKVKCDQIILRTNMDVGHGGASGRYELIREYALIYSWMFSNCSKK